MLPTWAWTLLVFAEQAVAIATIALILRRPREPRAMLAWILAILLLPVLGLVLYLMMGDPRRGWHRIRRRRRRLKLLASVRQQARALKRNVASPGDEFEYGVKKLATLARRLGAYPPTHGNAVTIYHDAAKTFLSLQLAIESAQSSVHLEYYIFQPDETGRAVGDLLIERARAGVSCRVLLDFVGCWRLPRSFLRPMRKAGVRVEFTMPVIPWRGRWRANFRNHRKIAVIDGRVGFTGSQNIGDEYSGRRRLKGVFRDTHMQIVGPSVHHLQEVFAHDWFYTTKEDLVSDQCFPAQPSAGDHIVQVVPSGPDQPIAVMHQMLFAAVGAARSSLCVITPYFVPDRAMVLAFQSAAYRGVCVQLLIPACSDHRLVLLAGRSFYDELIRAGVEIYEHDQTMLHSKVVIVDGQWASVGSANMDERSFTLNFELTTMLYSRSLAEVLYDDFKVLLGQSRRVKALSAEELPFRQAVAMGAARLASPLL